MEASQIILLFFGAIFVIAVVFVFWAIIASIRGVIRMVTTLSVGPAPAKQKRQPVLLTLRCNNDRCRSSNAQNARFCRRCGQQLTDQRRYATPRVAM